MSDQSGRSPNPYIMFNTIYPSSHVVVQYHQIHHQAQVDRRMTGRHQQGMVERPLQLFNFEVAPPPPQQQQQGGRRRVPPGYRQHQHNTPIPVMPSPHPHHHFRPVMNGRMQDFSNPRFFNGKHNMGRLYHGISAPCLSTASLGSGAVTGDESSDSGLSSRSPTPNRLQQSAAEEPSEKPKDSGKTEEDNPVPTQDNDREEDEDEGKGEEEDDNTENNLKNGRLRQHQYQQHHQHRQQYNNYQQYRRNDQQHHQHHQGGGGHYYAKRRMAPSGVPLANNQLPPGGRYPNHNNHHHNNFRGRRISVPAPYSVRFSSYPHFNTAPDRFYAKADQIEVKKAPDCLTNDSSWDQLSCAVWKKFTDHQQTESTYKKKMVLWKYLYIHVKTAFPKYGLYLVGSTLSGFGSNRSDVDMCLIVRQFEVDQRIEAISYLDDIQKLVEKFDFIEKVELIQAKVPILKFRDSHQELDVDLNCNNSVGIRNTHLLHCYADLDWRVRPLVLVVKLWADKHNINNAKTMTISSYSLALMVIHFLQCGVSPPVLPCLHLIYRHKFQPNSDINGIDMHERICCPPSENTQPLGELLAQFFKYYANFDYANNAISVRLGTVLSIEECRYHWTMKNDPHQWKYLCIEEPFDLTNTARSVYDPEVFSRIHQTIVKSAQLLSETLDLESIFTFDLDE